MRFKGRLELEHGLKQIYIIPLIDVAFLLLIYFVFSSIILVQPGVKVNLPQAVTSEVVQPAVVEIIISQENVIYLGNKIVSFSELKSFLKAAAKRNQAVLIKADRATALGKIVEIWDLCRDLGISQLNIATNRE